MNSDIVIKRHLLLSLKMLEDVIDHCPTKSPRASI